MLLLEIFLTIKAWKRGWRGWTLVLWGSYLLIAFCMGIVVAGTGVAIGTLDWLVLIACDIPLTIILGMMIKHPRVLPSDPLVASG